MRRRIFVALPFTLLAALGSGCSGDDGTGEDGSSGGYDVPHIDAGPIPDPFAYETVEDPWPEETAAACKAFVPEEGPDPYQEYRACACDTCIELMHQCDALQSCREIRQCGLDKGCADPNACYLAPRPGPRDPEGKGCVEVIDKWGNIGLGTYLSRKLGECTAAASCPRPQ
jgi:hypothetical protein